MDTKEEARGLLREAQEDFNRPHQYFSLRDWVTVVHYSQLAIEKSAKAIISCFESFDWTHDSSEQLKRLIKEKHSSDELLDMATYAKESAPWYGRSTYGGLISGVWRSPSEICSEILQLNCSPNQRNVYIRMKNLLKPFSGEKMDIEKVKEEIKKVVLKLKREDILAVGLFGSLARGDFHERSDIDNFVITERELDLKEQDKLYFAFSEIISVFRKGVNLLVYDLNSLKKIPTWQTLNLIKDANFIIDRAGVEKIFQEILQDVKRPGIFYDSQQKVFKLEKIERKSYSFNEESK